MNQRYDCVAKALEHASYLVDVPANADLLFVDQTTPIPYALIPQLGASYRLYITELPKAIPLWLIKPESVLIVIYRAWDNMMHAVVQHNNHIYDPQNDTHLKPEDILGRVVSIYLVMPALTIKDAQDAARMDIKL